MKKVVYFFLFLSIVLLVTAVSTPSTVYAADRCYPFPGELTGWWPGDGSTADLIAGRDAVLYGDATFGPGLVNQAFLLDGAGDFVAVPHDPALDLGTKDFTVTLWVRFNHTEGEQVLIEKWIQRFSAYSEGWTLTKLENNVIRLAMNAGEEFDINVDSEPLRIPSNTWLHFAAVRHAGRVAILINGRPVATVISRLNLDSTASLKFGHRGNPTDTPGSEDERQFFLDGQIDEVQLVNGRALTRREIQGIVSARNAGVCQRP